MGYVYLKILFLVGYDSMSHDICFSTCHCVDHDRHHVS